MNLIVSFDGLNCLQRLETSCVVKWFCVNKQNRMTNNSIQNLSEGWRTGLFLTGLDEVLLCGKKPTAFNKLTPSVSKSNISKLINFRSKNQLKGRLKSNCFLLVDLRFFFTLIPAECVFLWAKIHLIERLFGHK